MTRLMFPALGASAVAMMMAADKMREPASVPPGRVIENKGQAMPKGAMRAAQRKRTYRKASSRAAAIELVGMSNQTLVVAHLHPRWLREAVCTMMAEGVVVTHAMVDHFKAQGPDHAAAYVAQATPHG